MSPESFLTQATGATSASYAERIQSLWSGYGEIARYHLEGAPLKTVVLKHIAPPNTANHPRGWATDLSHQRKLRSYEVEPYFYFHYASRCPNSCRVPICYASEGDQSERWIALEDLDAAGFPFRKSSPTPTEIKRCLDWLASFHTTFLHTSPEGLWPTGTYWHLATRPNELAELKDSDPLKGAAPAIDKLLNNATHQTLVHGDAKVANFCFSNDAVAAVDFQYVGGGVGIKDVVYFLGSVLDEHALQKDASTYLDHYFATLHHFLSQSKHATIASKVIEEWRALSPVAWTDFHRFLLGWCPTHHKLTPYSNQLTKETLESLQTSN